MTRLAARGRVLVAAAFVVVAAGCGAARDDGGAVPVAAQARHQTEHAFEVVPTSAAPGDQVIVRGAECHFAEGHVSLTTKDRQTGFGSERYGVGADGTWAGQFRIPDATPPGRYQFNAECSTADEVEFAYRAVGFTVHGALARTE